MTVKKLITILLDSNMDSLVVIEDNDGFSHNFNIQIESKNVFIQLDKED